jgi:uncharacterized protein (DUF1501 family)
MSKFETMTTSHLAPAQPGRRRMLRHLGGAFAGALGMASVAPLLLSPRNAYAADYKALVCVFLYGGNDGLNTVVPTDTTRHAQYSAVRAGLALPRGSLLNMAGSDYGLHPALSALAPAWAEGKLAPVFNVGPLFAPLTKAQFRAAPDSSELVPDSLFSHSDQQVLWETCSTDALSRTGWGGRASQTLATINPVISLGGNGRFGIEGLRTPLVLPEPGATFGANGLQAADMAWAPNQLRKAAIDAMYAEGQDLNLATAQTQMQREAFGLSQRLGAMVKTLPGEADASAQIDAAFAPLIVNGKLTTGMARQLYQVAKLIAGNATVLGNRQMFFTELGGFDTHGSQLVTGSPTEGTHARLLKEVGDALGAFHNAMKSLGLSDAVTTFTQSDFGRTFLPNNSTGTDHAWGNHHLVLGGAVKGNATYGSYPELVLGGINDVGVDAWERQGRWLPTTSVDQYAATLLGWFGANDAQLDTVLPNLKNFGSARRLAFL